MAPQKNGAPDARETGVDRSKRRGADGKLYRMPTPNLDRYPPWRCRYGEGRYKSPVDAEWCSLPKVPGFQLCVEHEYAYRKAAAVDAINRALSR